MNKEISYSLPITIFKEGDSFVAYTPALDLSSVGRSESEAKKMFSQAVETFFTELKEMGTLDSVLLDLGWTKENSEFTPPQIVEHSLMSFTLAAV